MEDTIRWNLSGGAIYKADLAVLDILANYKWDRPINFASLGGIGANKGIAKYMQAEGVTYKLTPILFGSSGGTNTEKMYDLVMNDKFLWGNMKAEGVLVDYYTLRMVQNLRMQMMKLSDALISEGQNEKAIAILDKTFEIMPIENNQVAPDDICFYLCGNYYDAANALSASGDSTLYIEAKAKGDKLGKQLALLELEKIDHYQSLNEHFFEKVWTEWGRSLNNLEMLRQASIGGLDQEAMIASDTTNTFFANQGVLGETGYSTTLISAKQIFLKKGYTKQAFFQNPQRFPVVLAQYCWVKQ
jgi:tetratricopeptide (TPR) repeat protein